MIEDINKLEIDDCADTLKDLLQFFFGRIVRNVADEHRSRLLLGVFLRAIAVGEHCW